MSKHMWINVSKYFHILIRVPLLCFIILYTYFDLDLFLTSDFAVIFISDGQNLVFHDYIPTAVFIQHSDYPYFTSQLTGLCL